MYQNKSPWLKEPSNSVTDIIFKSQQPIGNTARADFLNEQYKNTVLKDIRIQLEYGIAKGALN